MRRILKFILLITFFLTSYLYNDKLKKEALAIEKTVESEESRKKIPVKELTEQLVFYYPDETMSKMLKGTREIPVTKDLKDKINLILSFIKEETESKISMDKKLKIDFMYKYLEVENIYFDKGTLYVDFNMDFRNDFENKNHELYFTYSIVNSFTEIKDVKRIKILIQGKEIKQFKFYKIDAFLSKYEKI